MKQSIMDLLGHQASIKIFKRKKTSELMIYLFFKWIDISVFYSLEATIRLPSQNS